MALRFEYAFTVKSRPDKVWAYLTDPYRVAPALPGAAITEKKDDGSYGGTITVKVGPVSARYKGTVRFENLDAAAGSAEIVARGQDLSGRGGADMRMQSRVAGKGDGETEVSVVSEVNVTGIMAQFGRGLIQDVSNQMFQRFTDAMRAELEKPDPAPAAAPPATAAAAAPATAAPAAGASPPADPGGGAAPAQAPAAPVTTAAAAPVTPAPPPAAASPPIEVVSFGTQILARAIGRTMRKPSFWIVTAALGGLVYWLVR